MDWKLFWIFVILNIVNVIIQTIKSIATVKCGKGMAAFVNAVAYGLYTVVVVYMVCDLPLWLKVVVIAICNLVGVFFVKWGEEKARKDKLWKVEATVPYDQWENLDYNLTNHFIEHNYILLGEKYAVFNIYCPTQNESKFAKQILDEHNAKYFVSESKTL
jgi:uncharacterized protein YebE (UPF0316 family)